MESNAYYELIDHSLMSILEHSIDMLFIKDKNLVYVAASKSFANLVGLENGADLIGKTDFDVFDKELAEKYTKDDRYIMEHEVIVENYIEPLPDQGGEKKYSSTSKYLVRDDKGEIIGIYGIARDVTAEVLLEKERENSKLSREMFDNVLEADLSNDCVLCIEGSGWIQDLMHFIQQPFTSLREEVANHVIHPDHREEFLAYYDISKMVHDYQLGKHEFSHHNLVMVSKDCYHWIEFRARLYHSRISDSLRITVFMQDKDREIRHRQSLQKKAATDALTGLSNRESILMGVRDALKQSNPEEQHALLFIDLDHFKQVNDHWGHQYGDKVLQDSAKRLQQIFQNGELIGRIGGDEFIVFLTNRKTREEIITIANALVDALSTCIVRDGLSIEVTASVGISICDSQNSSIEELYEQADKAMYRAKEQSGDQVCFYDDVMSTGLS